MKIQDWDLLPSTTKNTTSSLDYDNENFMFWAYSEHFNWIASENVKKILAKDCLYQEKCWFTTAKLCFLRFSINLDYFSSWYCNFVKRWCIYQVPAPTTFFHWTKSLQATADLESCVECVEVFKNDLDR